MEQVISFLMGWVIGFGVTLGFYSYEMKNYNEMLFFILVTMLAVIVIIIILRSMYKEIR